MSVTLIQSRAGVREPAVRRAEPPAEKPLSQSDAIARKVERSNSVWQLSCGKARGRSGMGKGRGGGRAERHPLLGTGAWRREQRGRRATRGPQGALRPSLGRRNAGNANGMLEWTASEPGRDGSPAICREPRGPIATAAQEWGCFFSFFP